MQEVEILAHSIHVDAIKHELRKKGVDQLRGEAFA